MTLLISKTDRTFDYIDIKNDSPYQISHFSKSEKVPEYTFCENIENIDLEPEQKRQCHLENKRREDEKNKWLAILQNDGLKSELKDEIKHYISKLEQPDYMIRKNIELSEHEEKEYKKKELNMRKNLVPITSVWKQNRCLDICTWYEMYSRHIEDIFVLVCNYINYLNMNGYDIRVNEKDMFQKIVRHIYKTSENVKSNYIFLK